MLLQGHQGNAIGSDLQTAAAALELGNRWSLWFRGVFLVFFGNDYSKNTPKKRLNAVCGTHRLADFAPCRGLCAVTRTDSSHQCTVPSLFVCRNSSTPKGNCLPTPSSFCRRACSVVSRPFFGCKWVVGSRLVEISPDSSQLQSPLFSVKSRPPGARY